MTKGELIEVLVEFMVYAKDEAEAGERLAAGDYVRVGEGVPEARFRPSRTDIRPWIMFWDEGADEEESEDLAAS